MTRVLFVRHGHTDAVGRVLAGRTGEWPLTERGRAEADAVADLLAAEHVDAVFSSPLERSVETAARVAEQHTLPVLVAPALDEVDWGAFSGRAFDELSADPAWQTFHRARPCHPPPGGEHLVAVQDRLARWMASLAALPGAGRVVVAVSHADPIRVALLHLLGASWELAPRLDIPTGSVSAVEIGDAPRVLYVGRVGPLPAGAAPGVALAGTAPSASPH